jgi:serine protease Do
MIRKFAFIGCLIAGFVIDMTFGSQTTFADEATTGFFQRLGQFDPPSKNSRGHESVRFAFRDVVSSATKSTVRLLVSGNQVALGTVVHADGLILTKASELKGEVVCALRDGRRLPAKIVGISHDHDLALLKLEKTKLIPVEWADGDAPQVGAWLATTSCAADPRAIGIVSALPRRIAMPVAVLGIRLRATRQGAQVMKVIADSSASKARILKGDIVFRIGDTEVSTPEEVTLAIQNREPGDQITLAIRRDGKRTTIKATLGNRQHLGNQAQSEVMEHLGGPLSKRRGGFPSAIQHDTVLRPRDCGGPVVDIDGNVVGINIARVSRVASYAIPAKEIKAVLPELLSGKYAIPAATVDQVSGRP